MQTDSPLARAVASTDNGVTSAFNWNNGFPGTFPPLPIINPSLLNGTSIQQWDRGYNRPPMIQNIGFQIGRELRTPHSCRGGLRREPSFTACRRIIEVNQIPLSALSLGSLLTQPFSSPAARAAGIVEPFAGFGALYNPLGDPARDPSVAQALAALPTIPEYPKRKRLVWEPELQLFASQGDEAFRRLPIPRKLRMVQNLGRHDHPMRMWPTFGSQGILAQHLAIRSTGKSLAANGGTPAAGQMVKMMYSYDLPLGHGKSAWSKCEWSGQHV